MKERSIIFTADSVRAILEWRKSQTRRVVKPQPNGFWGTGTPPLAGGVLQCITVVDGKARDTYIRCPYGVPGDRLWVKETWLPDPPCDGTWAYTQWAGCSTSQLSDIPIRFRAPAHCIFKASWDGDPAITFKPSMFMPRWASRILLEITAVRVQRVQEIGLEALRAEGINLPGASVGQMRMWFAREVWDSINAKRGYSWESNPWVWAVSFKRV